MSKYVDKKHGLTIGSDNWFFYKDEKGEVQTFPAIVSFRDYQFDSINSLNYCIRTPAAQLVWDKVEWETDPRTTNIGGDEFSFTETEYGYVPPMPCRTG